MYSPIYNTNDWSPSGDVYVGGKATQITAIFFFFDNFMVQKEHLVWRELSHIIPCLRAQFIWLNNVILAGTTGLLIWAVTLAGLLAGGALLVYSTSALAQ